MELKEFIKETISDIALAINDLNDKCKIPGLLVNPKSHYYPEHKTVNDKDLRPVKDIKFHLSVSISEKAGAGGGLRIQVISAGMNKESGNELETTVEFSIPIVWPGIDNYPVYPH